VRFKTFSASLIAAVLTAFSVGAAGQSNQQPAQNPSQSQTMQSRQGMMGGGMKGTNMMGPMEMHHQQMLDVMNKLMRSMAAIQNEKDPEALKQKLAEHSALLKQMQDQMTQQGKMMRSMSGMTMRNCPAASDSTAPATK
jgi:hypothetical protein